VKSDISQDLLKSALEAALTAPNHRFTFPWHFALVGPQGREEILELAVRMKMAKKDAGDQDQIRRKLVAKMLNPAGLVIFYCKRSEDPFTAREDYASVACAIQNFTLFLTEKGYGTKWSTGKVSQHKDVYQIAGVDSDKWECVGFVWAGHPEGRVPPRRRPALSDVLSVTS